MVALRPYCEHALRAARELVCVTAGKLPPLPAPEPCLRLLKFISEKQIQGSHAVFQSQ